MDNSTMAAMKTHQKTNQGNPRCLFSHSTANRRTAVDETYANALSPSSAAFFCGPGASLPRIAR